MDCDIILDDSFITIPQTYIKSPGFRFHQAHSREQTPTAILSQTSLDSLLTEFKAKSELKRKYTGDILKTSDDPEGSIGLMIKRYSSMEPENRPGEKKKASDEGAELIHLSQKILSNFGIELVIKACSSQSRRIQNVLRFLVPEVCLFPLGLFKKLEISQFVFCEQQDAEEQPLFVKAISFSMNALDSQDKVMERLYQIIFTHILLQHKQKPLEYNKDWSTGVFDFAKAFMGLMKTVNNVLLKGRIDDLKKWIVKEYPEMTEDWFKARNKEKKKMGKVSFSFDSSTR